MQQLSWITQVAPKWNHKCPDEVESQGDLTQKKRRKQCDLKGRQPRVKEGQQPADTGGSEEQIPQRLRREHGLLTPGFQPCGTDFRLRVSRPMTE